MSRRRGSAQSFVLVLAGAVHVAFFGLFSSSPLTFFKVVDSPASTAEENDGAVTAQKDDASDATPEFRSDGKISKAASYLSFLMEPRVMCFSQGSELSFAGAKDLARQTNTIIKYSGDGDWFPYDGRWKKIVTIAGESSHILKAFSKMLSPTWSENNFVSVLIPRSAVGNFIGDGGKKIGLVRKKTGANIIFADPVLSRYRKLRIQGSSAAVKAAVSWILDEQDDAYINESRAMLGATHGAGMDSPTEIFLALDEEQSRYLVGAGGATARSIHRDFKVALLKDRGTSMWKLSGSLGDVHAAHHFIVTNLMSARGLLKTRSR